MPNTISHLAFAEETYRRLSPIITLDRVNFLSGNLIPDLSVDKGQSHYRKSSSIYGLLVPDLSKASNDLFKVEDSIKLGMYAHLYLDYYFIEHFLIHRFIWDVPNMEVINPKTNHHWSVYDFFSQKGLYGAYTQVSQSMLNSGYVSFDTIKEIPEFLPETGIVFFDNRNNMTWKNELEYHLGIQPTNYSGEILDYRILWSFIEKMADKFVTDFFGTKHTETA